MSIDGQHPGAKLLNLRARADDSVRVHIRLINQDLYATPIIITCMCGVSVQQIYSMKSSKLAIHKNLDPRKFSAIYGMFIMRDVVT